MFIRRRRFVDLQQEYGENHEVLAGFKRRRSIKQMDEATFLEEIWFFDNTDWAVAVADSSLPASAQGREFYSRGQWDDYQGGSIIDWLAEPVTHRIGRCPVIEKKRMTHDDAYRGALEDTIPQLRLAQNIQAASSTISTPTSSPPSYWTTSRTRRTTGPAPPWSAPATAKRPSPGTGRR
jgi:hypothetical protein